MSWVAREPEVGSEITPVTKIAKNTALGLGIHDDARARTLGFKGALVPGITTLAYVMEMLMNLFGENWMTSGQINLSFINPLYEGERVTARAIVSDKKPEDSGLRLLLDVWAENDEGGKVAAGTASGLLPPVASP
ncbi:MAG: hypothetical protein E3J42_04830 [Dehalococcoidia bacterium]|nr:MAG: hypothetical protein E3J42_04830 [Dehalococcoidia bacterium]